MTHYGAPSQSQSTLIFDESKEIKSKTNLANDKLFLKNVSLRNMRQMYNPAGKKSIGSSQSFINSAIFNQKPMNSIKTYDSPANAMITVPGPQSLERQIDPNDPFDLMIHRNESVVQVIKRQKKKKDNNEESTPSNMANLQLQHQMLQKQLKSISPMKALANSNTNLNSQKNLLQKYSGQAEKISQRQKKMAGILNKNSSQQFLLNNNSVQNLSQQMQQIGPQNFTNYQTQYAFAPKQSFSQQNNPKNQKVLSKRQSQGIQKSQSGVSLVQSSDRNHKKKNLNIGDHYENFYTQIRLRSGSSDQLTMNNSKEADDISTGSRFEKMEPIGEKNSHNIGKVQRKKSMNDKKQVVQNIQNNINLSFAGAFQTQTQIIDPLVQQVKTLDYEQQKKISLTQEEPVAIYLDSLKEVSNLIKSQSQSAYELLIKVQISLKECFNKQKQQMKDEMNQYQKVIEELQEQLQLEQSKNATFNLEVSQLKKKNKLLEQTLAKKDQGLLNLQQQIEDQQKQSRQFLGKYDENKILEEIKVLVGENQELKSAVREIKSELDYGKQRENKLMYFLFVLQRKGIPIYEIFDLNIKDLPTTRFSPDLDDQYKKIYFEQLRKFIYQRRIINQMPFPFQMERMNQSVPAKRIKWFEQDKNGQFESSSINDISQNLSDSYYPICSGPVIIPTKPKAIPSLDLKLVEQVQQQRLKQQMEQEIMKMKQQQQDADDSQDDDEFGEDDDNEQEISIGVRSTTRIQQILRKSKYQPLEGMPVNKDKRNSKKHQEMQVNILRQRQNQILQTSSQQDQTEDDQYYDEDESDLKKYEQQMEVHINIGGKQHYYK
ncbi:UNKNOWN [Stylonychia lemnae]|uniref:Uncharacterized protein n=1 Tax=Stylonychia lemnae TaxID=5949 RepID=A0A078A131_STYLE|nr:UNKNOWN [Stylonychia lemnae]|eukprot:CDW75815.1 UNKNOWN [Stylonychia lemnae]